jgi:hypothetical protein
MSDSNYKPVSVGDWMMTALLLGIPVVNIILLFVWAFGSNTPISKANFSKAILLWFLISMVFSAVLFFVFGVGAALLASVFGVA